MMKKTALILTVCVLALGLAACAKKPEAETAVVTVPERFETAVAAPEAAEAVSAPTDVPEDINWDDYADAIAAEEGIDAASVEETGTVTSDPIHADAGVSPTSVPEVIVVYPGATPVVIDPVDKPTPTPVPEMKFSEYSTYDATKLRLSFEAPKGWESDDSLSDTYVLINPDTRFPYQAQLIVTARAVSTDYSTNDLKKEVLAVVDNLKPEFTSFSKTNTATRTLFDKNGVYIDFDGYVKGTENRVWGRVHAVTVNKTLVVLRITAPYEYSRTYKDGVYSRFRKTVKFTK